MKVPKYYRVKQRVLDLIAESHPGSPVPTERELALRFDTSRTTVRQAIGELVVEGRLERVQGRGTFVARPKLMQVQQMTSFTEDLSVQGWQPGSRVLAIEDIAADEVLAARLGIGAGGTVHRLDRVRTSRGEPIGREVAHLAAELTDLRGLAEDLERLGSLYRTLREVHGIEIDTVEDTVETVLADPAQAALLEVDTGLPMLLVHRTAWDASGRTVEWTRSVFRGDRFRFVARQRLGQLVTG